MTCIRSRQTGFSLLELLVSLGVFLVIAAAAFSLVNQHIPIFTSQQNQSALNFSLRSAAAQMQIDLANAGSGFYPSADIVSSPIAVTIDSPESDTGCFDESTHTYSSNCFDTLRVVKIDRNTPLAQVGKLDEYEKIQAHEKQCDNGNNLNVSPTMFILPAQADPASHFDELAAHFQKDDQILVIKKDSGNPVGTAKLTSAAKSTGTGVKLDHKTTRENGQNAPEDNNDDYMISKYESDKLEHQFCIGDWVLKLSPAVYTVDASDKTNPKLVRLQPGDPDCSPTQTAPFKPQCVLAEQIIGFRVGVLLKDDSINTTNPNDCKPYCYKPTSYGGDWSQIRAVRITIIGRTQPNKTASTYRNEFDKGPYKIEAVSVVVSPRSLTMRDEK